MKRIMVERIVFDKDEREIKKSWGKDWSRMMKDAKQSGFFLILRGVWNGKTVHTQYAPLSQRETIVLREIVFSDGTTMGIDFNETTLEVLMMSKIKRKAAYDDLITEARSQLVETYRVDGQRIDAATQAVEERKRLTEEGVSWIHD